MLDCLVIGAGPAGLAAAIYLARFRLNFRIVDAGESRCQLIPRSRNFPGYPQGIPGAELLQRMRAQLGAHGISPEAAAVLQIERQAAGFSVRTEAAVIPARTVLLATGKEDERPHFQDGSHDRAVLSSVLRYCPICDGFEAAGKNITVLGMAAHGMREALFLRRYSSDIELICPSGAHCFNPEDAQRLDRAGIRLLNGPVHNLHVENNKLVFHAPAGEQRRSIVYAALGCRQRSELAAMLGAALSEDGCIVVDPHQRTTVSGLYAAGDVIVGLDQIATAIGHAAIAATAIRNDLA